MRKIQLRGQRCPLIFIAGDGFHSGRCTGDRERRERLWGAAAGGLLEASVGSLFWLRVNGEGLRSAPRGLKTRAANSRPYEKSRSSRCRGGYQPPGAGTTC